MARNTKPDTIEQLPNQHQQPRRVRFAQVDTQNGKYLFEARKDLRLQGTRPFPGAKRKDSEKPLERFLQKNPQIQDAQKPSAPILPKRSLGTAISPFAMPLMLLSLVISPLAITGAISLMTAMIVGAISSAVVLYNYLNVLDAKKILAKGDNGATKWLEENKEAYDLGYTCKTWSPYLWSYLQPTAYWRNTAFRVGLDDALENEKPEKSCCVKTI
jgi:hypothetical protein